MHLFTEISQGHAIVKGTTFCLFFVFSCLCFLFSLLVGTPEPDVLGFGAILDRFAYACYNCFVMFQSMLENNGMNSESISSIFKPRRWKQIQKIWTLKCIHMSCCLLLFCWWGLARLVGSRVANRITFCVWGLSFSLCFLVHSLRYVGLWRTIIVAIADLITFAWVNYQ